MTEGENAFVVKLVPMPEIEEEYARIRQQAIEEGWLMDRLKKFKAVYFDEKGEYAFDIPPIPRALLDAVIIEYNRMVEV